MDGDAEARVRDSKAIAKPRGPWRHTGLVRVNIDKVSRATWKDLGLKSLVILSFIVLKYREVSVDRNTATETHTLKYAQGGRNVGWKQRKTTKNHKNPGKYVFVIILIRSWG